MVDLSWLATEAKTIHSLFTGVFYGLITVLLLIGVVFEYFKLPLGGVPQTAQLVGRALIAAILLNTYPEVSNAIADFTDALSKHLGSLNEFKLVLSKMGDKLGEFAFSWTSVKETLMLTISFVTFFLLYISVYIADAAIVYAWVMLYVFSPLLIALYVLPATSGAAKTLYRSLIEVSAWKIVWSVLATLLWSAALSNINQPEANVNFITAISFNLMLAASMLLTPFVVNALTSKGITSLAGTMGGMAAGAAFFNPGMIAKASGVKVAKGGADLASTGVSRFRDRYFQSRQLSGPKGPGGPTGGGNARRMAIESASRKSEGQESVRTSVPKTQERNESQQSVRYRTAASQYQPPKNRSSIGNPPAP